MKYRTANHFDTKERKAKFGIMVAVDGIREVAGDNNGIFAFDSEKERDQKLKKLVEDDAIEYQPKGSMCLSCKHQASDCSGLDFQSMRVIEKNEYHRVVKCSEFERNR